MFAKPLTRAPLYILIKSFFVAIGQSYLHDLWNVFKKIETTIRWYCVSKALRFLQITAKHQDFPFFTVFLTIKTSSQNISITYLQIPFQLHEYRGDYWLPWTILLKQFPAVRKIAASIIGKGVILLPWQLQCHCNPDHNKF